MFAETDSVRFPCIKEDHKSSSYFLLLTFLGLPAVAHFYHFNAINKPPILNFTCAMYINLCTPRIAVESLLADRRVFRNVCCARSLRSLLYKADW